MKATNFITQIYAGKTLGRILLNWKIAESCRDLSGVVVDLAGGGSASYYDFVPKGVSIIRTNYTANGTDLVVDFNKRLPFEDSSLDAVLLFNALYIAEDRAFVLNEIRRVLKTGGRAFISMPFLYNEMKEPHDFCRLTHEGLEYEFHRAGFEKISLTRLGERASASVNLLHPLFFFKTIRLVFYSVALLFDKLIPTSLKRSHPAPIQYFCVVTK